MCNYWFTELCLCLIIIIPLNISSIESNLKPGQPTNGNHRLGSGLQNVLADATTDTVNSGPEASSGNGAPEHSVYLEKLNALRKKGGLEAYSGDRNGTSGSSGIGSAGSSHMYKISSHSSAASTASADTDRYSDYSSSSSTITPHHALPTYQNNGSSEDTSTAGTAYNSTEVEDIRKRLERIKHSAYQ